jgi:hypothetical protein
MSSDLFPKKKNATCAAAAATDGTGSQTPLCQLYTSQKQTPVEPKLTRSSTKPSHQHSLCTSQELFSLWSNGRTLLLVVVEWSGAARANAPLSRQFTRHF